MGVLSGNLENTREFCEKEGGVYFVLMSPVFNIRTIYFDAAIPNAVAVAEFKGPEIYGVVWILQLNMTMAQINATFCGLSEGPHGWSINEYGDLSQGAASTGKIYNPPSSVELNEVSGPNISI